MLAIARDEGGQVRPGPELELRLGDRVVLLGAGEALQLGHGLLEAPSEHQSASA